MDFLFHKVSDKEKEGIRKEAKQIMDRFSKKLSKIPVSKLKGSLVERDVSERPEGLEKPAEIDRKIMFENAPEKNDDFIFGEKKKW
ncbi:MAG: hypothetical protein ACE5ES_03470 [Candidatus Nanoarchaeia archaeon]